MYRTVIGAAIALTLAACGGSDGLICQDIASSKGVVVAPAASFFVPVADVTYASSGGEVTISGSFYTLPENKTVVVRLYDSLRSTLYEREVAVRGDGYVEIPEWSWTPSPEQRTAVVYVFLRVAGTVQDQTMVVQECR